jgi:glycosyltransferase involved in cell wall biosynthesis
MTFPLVTIVTPSFNQGRFIRATIESVLSQDYPNLEYIIMDGGSTDETSAIVAEYGNRLQWISEKDRGQSHAINKGFRMAKGDIVSWLNSDDIILPGAVASAVNAFIRNPQLGAVYGEGYQIDIDGRIKCRFPATEPFNLWKLVYLCDYVLQQTAYFGRGVFEEIGYIDENLHWGMDWDILIRIGKRFPMEYVPEYLGSLREYPTAKSFSGGGKRFRELVRIMRRHGELRYPPGYIFYGLDTYSSLACNWIERLTPKILEPASRQLRRVVRGAADKVITHTAKTAQGLYSDGWAGPQMKYMLGPGSGTVMMEGLLPGISPDLKHQRLRIDCNGRQVADLNFDIGEFSLTFDVPPDCAAQAASFVIRASNSLIPKRCGCSHDSRRLAYMLKSFQWVTKA